MSDNGQAIAKLRYTHDALIDAILARPAASQRQLASLFGYTESWLSRVMSSDVFKQRLHARREELVDPSVIAEVDQLFEALARQSITIVQERMEATRDAKIALEALRITKDALGYGARTQASGAVSVNTYVVAMPGKSLTGREWISEHSPLRPSGPAAGNGSLEALEPERLAAVEPKVGSADLKDIDLL